MVWKNLNEFADQPNIIIKIHGIDITAWPSKKTNHLLQVEMNIISKMDSISNFSHTNSNGDWVPLYLQINIMGLSTMQLLNEQLRESSRFIHVVACVRISFLFKRLNNIPLYVYITFCFIHSSTDGHSGCFHIWLF